MWKVLHKFRYTGCARKNTHRCETFLLRYLREIVRNIKSAQSARKNAYTCETFQRGHVWEINHNIKYSIWKCTKTSLYRVFARNVESRAYVPVFAMFMKHTHRCETFHLWKITNQSGGWTAHERIRTGVKCFTMCDTCRKSFGKSSYVRVHNIMRTSVKHIMCSRAYVSVWEIIPTKNINFKCTKECEQLHVKPFISGRRCVKSVVQLCNLKVHEWWALQRNISCVNLYVWKILHSGSRKSAFWCKPLCKRLLWKIVPRGWTHQSSRENTCMRETSQP